MQIASFGKRIVYRLLGFEAEILHQVSPGEAYKGKSEGNESLPNAKIKITQRSRPLYLINWTLIQR